MLNGEQNKLVEGSAELRGARLECKHAEKLKTCLIRLSLKQTAAAAEDRCVPSLPKTRRKALPVLQCFNFIITAQQYSCILC